MYKHLVLLVYFFQFLVLCSSAQDDKKLISELIRNIAAMQVTDDGEFYAGMFPSFREAGGAPHNYQPDNNIFYTAVIAFALQKMLADLQGEDKNTAQEILNKIRKVYPYYKNKNDFPYYNFWPAGAPIMPHSYFLKYLTRIFKQGEDADDSVIILLTNNSDKKTASALKERLIERSNLFTKKRKIISTYNQYKNIPAYTTYLGEYMTPDFDFAVQCNIMYFMYDKKLPFTKQDTATLYLIADMVKNRKYMTAPVYISPYYVHSSILIYHLTRLMGAFKIPELEKYKEQLINDIHIELAMSNKNIMDKIILRTALLRLNSPAPILQINTIEDFEKTNQDKFVFFQARAAFSYPTPLKQIFLHWSYMRHLFFCIAYNKTLWLEYLVEKNKK